MDQVLTGKNLSLGYEKGQDRKVILSDLNFQLYSGQLTCLLGPNGVGKSTLIKAILGRIRPFEGEIKLLDKSPVDYPREKLSKKLSVVLSEPIIPAQMTVEQLVGLGRTPYLKWSGTLSELDRNYVDEALAATKMDFLRKERLGELSDGQRQKAMIARALAQDGKVIILDEPTSHLDLVNRHEIMFLLQDIAKNQDKAILVVTHDLDIAIETAHQLWLMNCGSPLIAGLPEDLILNAQINELLPKDRFFFDPKRGKVNLRSEDSGWEIQGSEDLVFWLEKALKKRKSTFRTEERIHVLENPFRIQVGDRIYHSIAEFFEVSQTSLR
ncbi:ABC transporter ATP-binding protein [Algoriphagus formosus]|uniref:ABC transporter ATP-binding protein n=1 Tax=Algoriphagus formosus TaxID=2007308 RepID=A0A4R5VB33_9BACT|nr:ABC transporter ATP-binding protein [Algoriphagus aquimaris]TDK48845.1 ABC transporter ATP-binding protein [Algoriphagus aquimaris]